MMTTLTVSGRLLLGHELVPGAIRIIGGEIVEVQRSPGEIPDADLTAAATLLREIANQAGGSDFLKQYARLSGIVLRAPDALTLWLNPLARHKPPPDLVSALRRLA